MQSRATRLACGVIATAVLCTARVLAAEPEIAYVTPNRSLSDLEVWMTKYYEKLKSEDKLPVQAVTDDWGTSVQNLTFALGLLRGRTGKPAFPESMDRLMCQLNAQLCRIGADGKTRWTNKKGDRICMPDVQWVDGVNFARVEAPKEGDLTARLEEQFGTCTVLGAQCRLKTAASRERMSKDGKMQTVVLAQAAKASAARATTQCERAETAPASSKTTEQGIKYLEVLGVEPPTSSSGTSFSSGHTADLIGRAIRLDPAMVARAQAHRSGARALERGIVSDAAGAEMASIATSAGADEEPVLAEAAEATSTNAVAMSTVTATVAAPATAAVPAPASAPIPAVAPAPVSAPVPASAPVVTPPAAAPAPVAIVEPQPIDNDVFGLANLVNFRVVPQTPRKIQVMVFDWDVTPCHVVLMHAINAQGCVTTAFDKFSIVAEPETADHGNHIAALIAGAYGVGINPSVSLLPVQILGAAITQMTHALYNTISTRISTSPREAKIANFSLDLKPQEAQISDQIQDMIDANRDVLFVAAAGDEHGSMDGECRVLPACVKVGNPLGNNLLVVGGASKTPAGWVVWPGSRFGQRVDILAPAEQIESAVRANGTLGRMTGSSQSAALMSGLAARLFQADLLEVDDWSPAQIKNRLLATARFSSALTDFTRSGVVDADQALETSHQVLVVNEGGQRKTFHGELLRVTHPDPEVKNAELPFLLADGSTSVNMCRIYRLSQNDGHKWTIAYQPVRQESPARWSRMQIEPNVSLGISHKSLEFQPEGAAVMSVPIENVLEFYDKFSGNLACRPQ